MVVTLPRAFYHKAQEASCKAWVIGGTMLTGQTLANPAPGTTMQHPRSRVGDGTGCVTQRTKHEKVPARLLKDPN